ncbi:MAG: hypothetical protein JWP29_2007 [Rhodoferax sp.]|nr:hypothetical protein [Rhodoferax sp.]
MHYQPDEHWNGYWRVWRSNGAQSDYVRNPAGHPVRFASEHEAAHFCAAQRTYA